MSDQQARPVPTVNRTVSYKLAAWDVDKINHRRASTGAHGNDVKEGQVYPMVIVRVWGDTPDAAVNGQVLLDGEDTYWATSRVVGDQLGQYSWPARG